MLHYPKTKLYAEFWAQETQRFIITFSHTTLQCSPFCCHLRDRLLPFGNVLLCNKINMLKKPGVTNFCSTIYLIVYETSIKQRNAQFHHTFANKRSDINTTGNEARPFDLIYTHTHTHTQQTNTHTHTQQTHTHTHTTNIRKHTHTHTHTRVWADVIWFVRCIVDSMEKQTICKHERTSFFMFKVLHYN
jgi:hypothetical protein